MPRRLVLVLGDQLDRQSAADEVRAAQAAAAGGITDTADLAAIDAKMDRHEPDIAFIPSADFLRMLIATLAYAGVATCPNAPATR